MIKGNPFSEEGRRSNFNLLSMHNKDELDITDLRIINQQLKYGYDDHQLKEIIQSIGGFNSETIPYYKFNAYVRSRVRRHN